MQENMINPAPLPEADASTLGHWVGVWLADLFAQQVPGSVVLLVCVASLCPTLAAIALWLRFRRRDRR